MRSCLAVLSFVFTFNSVGAHAAPTIPMPRDATLRSCAMAQLEAAVARSSFPRIEIQKIVPRVEFPGLVDYFKVYGSLDGHPVKGVVYPFLRSGRTLDASGQRRDVKICTLQATLLCLSKLKLRNATNDLLVNVAGECLP